MQQDLGELVKVLSSLMGAAWRAERVQLSAAENTIGVLPYAKP